MSSQEQWFVLRYSGRNAGGQFAYDCAYSRDIEKLKEHAAQRAGKSLEWTERNHAKNTDMSGYDIVPDDKTVILL